MVDTPRKIVKCLLWNPTSIKPKRVEFENFIEAHQPKIIILAETWLRYDENFTLSNYTTHRYDRATLSNNTNNPKIGGGVAILVHKTLKCRSLAPIPVKKLENVPVEIELVNKTLTIVAIYNPPTKPDPTTFSQDLNKIINTYNRVVIAGDFNAKHRNWNCLGANSCGNALNNIIQTHKNIMLNHPDEPTCCVPGRNPSTIDLILSKNYPKITNIESIQDLSSNHLPVLFELGNTPIQTPIIPPHRKIDWTSFRYHIIQNTRWDPNSLTESESIEGHVNSLTDNIRKAIDSASTIPPITKNYKTNHPFCSVVKDLVTQRNKLRRIAARTLDRSLRHPINRLTKLIKSQLENNNNNAWNKKLQEIKPNHTSVWKIVKHLKNRRCGMPPLKLDEEVAYSNLDKAKMLAKQFHLSHQISRHPTDPAIESQAKRAIQEIESSTTQLTTEDVVHPSELRLVLKNIRSKKAPGHDNLTPLAIKNLPKKGVMYLLAIINACLRVSYFPLAWKHAKVIAIKKPNKPSSETSSYRPISLLPILGKILERTIFTRLLSHVKSKEILANHQFGFRSGHSAQHQLVRLGEHISSMSNMNRSTGLVMLDIEKAFDSVWHEGLLCKLHNLKFPNYLLKIVKSFLQNRSFKVHIQGESSESLDIPAGVPQGSILSPILFNLFINDLPTPKSCQLAVFADDTALFSSITKGGFNILSKRLEVGVLEILQFYKLWKIRVNTEKTQAVLFTHSKHIKAKAATGMLTIDNSVIQWQKNGKYLGCTLDSRLTFQLHINSKISLANKAIHAMYALLYPNSKLNKTNKLLLYKVAIRPILTYACALWANAAESHINKIQVVQNKCLRNALSLPKSTPIRQLHELANIPTISQYIDKLTNKFYSTCTFLENPLISSLGNTHQAVTPFRIKHKLIRKLS